MVGSARPPTRSTAAIDIFDRLPAPIWAERARAGGSARRSRRPAADEGHLSATEREIARLARRGRTNREIADELDVSPKTVEWNLTRIYQKLGVRSRTELAARDMPAED
jgi:DNA-binding CsgD family transcriptional regulator